MISNKHLKSAALLIAAVLLSGCGGGGTSPASPPGQPPSSALSISATLAPDKTYDVGDIQDGWLMRVPKGTFGDQPTTLDMRTATESELKTLAVPPDAQVLSLSANGQHNVRLRESVSIAVRIPSKLNQSSPWELMYGYHTANGWEYWPFKKVDLAASTAVIEAQHFSLLWGPAKPSTAERLAVYSRTMAAEYTQKELARQALVQKLGPDMDKTLASLGITDQAVIMNLSTNMISYLESAHIEYALTANAALSPMDSIARIATGNEDERKEKSLEVIAKSLHWALAKGGPNKWLASGIGSLGALGTAAGALAGGDSETAGKATYTVLKGLLSTAAPGTGLVFMVGEAAVGSVQNAVDAFAASELEKAYQVYSGKSSGKGYFETGSGNIEALLAEMAGGGRQLENRILDNYCAKRMIKPCDLGQRAREIALDKGRESLKAYFVQRKKNEDIYKTFEQQEKDFVAELEKDQYLLVDGFYKQYFGDGEQAFDIEDRLQRIYRIRDTLRGIFDGPNASKMTHRDMVLAIRSWMSHTVNKTRPKFYEWAIEQGYTSPSFKPDAVTPPPIVPPTVPVNVNGDYLAYLVVTNGIDTSKNADRQCNPNYLKLFSFYLTDGAMYGDIHSWLRTLPEEDLSAATSSRVYGKVTGQSFSGREQFREVNYEGAITQKQTLFNNKRGEGTWILSIYKDTNSRVKTTLCSGTFDVYSGVLGSPTRPPLPK